MKYFLFVFDFCVSDETPKYGRTRKCKECQIFHAAIFERKREEGRRTKMKPKQTLIPAEEEEKKKMTN